MIKSVVRLLLGAVFCATGAAADNGINDTEKREAMENLKEYAARLESALSRQEPFSTYNRDIFHAFAITLAAFKYAQKEVLLLSHQLDVALYGGAGLRAAIERFLGRGGKLRILAETDIDADHPMVQLRNEFPEQVTIKRVPDEQLEHKFNFMIVDDFGVRFESDREEYAAVASFHEERAKDLIASLKRVFSRLDATVASVGQPAEA